MKNSAERIAVTGMGAVTPLGHGVETTWQRLCEGRNGISEIDLFSMDGFRFTQGGQIREQSPFAEAPELDPLLDRLLIFCLAACREAMLHAATTNGHTGLILATNFGETGRTEALIAQTQGIAELDLPALPYAAPDATVRRLAELLLIDGPTTTVSLSCSSGSAALALGAQWLSSGRVERVLVVGGDVLSKLAWSGLSALRTMTRKRLCPFDVARDGTLFSEGAAALLLTGVDDVFPDCSIAELCGWATNNNAFHLTAPSPEGAGSASVMQQALRCAAMPAEAIGHINAHGTSTKHNDITESQAIRNVFGRAADGIAVTSIKSMLGHMMGAAGTIEAVATLCSLRDQCVPPTINVEQQDPDCDIDLVSNTARTAKFSAALSNSAGIGGCNAAVIFRSIN